MATKTNRTIKNKHGQEFEYYRTTATVGKRLNKHGVWVPKRKEFLGKSKKEAEAKRDEYMIKKRNNITYADMCFGEIADRYVYEVFRVSNYAEGTKDRYIRAYQKVLQPADLTGKIISEIGSADFQELFNSSGIAPSTLQHALDILKLIYKYIEREDFGKNITSNILVPNKKKKQENLEAEIVIWEDEELYKILANLGNTRHRFLIVLGASTGCRIGELLALKYDDLISVKANGLLRIEKQVTYANLYDGNKRIGREPVITEILKSSKSNRLLPIKDEVIIEFERQKKWHEEEMKVNGYQSDRLFTTSTGAFYDQSNLNTSLKRFYKRIGVSIDKTFHTYRRTYATKLVHAGTRIEVLADLLGHEDITVTKKYYTFIYVNDKKEAVEATCLLSGIESDMWKQCGNTIDNKPSQKTNPLNFQGVVVPRPRIELGTRRFSVCCSTN